MSKGEGRSGADTNDIIKNVATRNADHLQDFSTRVENKKVGRNVDIVVAQM